MARSVLLGSFTLALLATAAPFASAEDYTCDDQTRLTATFIAPPSGAGAVKIVFVGTGAPMTLPRVPSADGARFAAGIVEFWIRGSQATLRQADKVTTCKR